jgi:D-glycero-D-manno-heptose 1,7-bisphosphate phosphatase
VSAPARVVLLDRDGTLVVDRHYLADPAGLRFLPGAVAGLQRLHGAGHRLVVISNQSGVGRGLFSLAQLSAVNARLAAMVQEIGVQLAGIYCCPHRPEDACDCRKPATGLVRQAAAELGFDPAGAIVIGDKASDVELGRRLGALTIRIAAAQGWAPGPSGPPAPATPDRGGGDSVYVAADLLQAADLIAAL